MNKTRIIKSLKIEKKNPYTAFLLSSVFTGLGQVYNCKINAGFALLLLKILPPVIVPLFIKFQPADSYIKIFAASILFSVIVTIYSPVEASIFAVKNRETRQKRYNSYLFYVIFSVLNISLSLFAAAAIFSFFEIKSIPGGNYPPIFRAGEFILVNRYTPRGYTKGELVIFNENNSENIGRIIAMGNTSVEFSKGIFYLNGVPLPFGVPDEEEMDIFSFENNQDILTETNGEKKYPIKLNLEKSGDSKLNLITEKDQIIVANDNRMGKKIVSIIYTHSVTGRIEGIILSGSLKRFFIKPFYK